MRSVPPKLCLLLVTLLLVACGGEAAPTPDAVATQVAVARAAAATLTAEVPTPTNTLPPPTETPAPELTDTPSPTSTPKPTSTPEPTNTSTSTPRPTPTPRPTSTPTPPPMATIEPYEDWKASTQTDITYKLVDKSDQYIGERVCWKGEVFNIDESSGITVFQAWYFEGRSFNILKDDAGAFMVVYFGTLPDVFEDDAVEVCGLVDEKGEGVNAYGATITQPQILAVYVNKYKPPPQPAAKPKPPTPTPVLVQIGQETTAGKWFLRVTGVEWHKALYFYDNAEVAMGVWCVLFLDIQNQASGTDYFGNLWWELRGSGGGVYDDDSGTSEAAWQFGGKDTPWTDLNPGEWAEIVIAFDVAEGAKGLQFYSGRLKQPFVYIGDAQPPQDP